MSYSRNDEKYDKNGSEREKVLNYKDYINPRPIVPQRLGLNAHGIYTNTLNG